MTTDPVSGPAVAVFSPGRLRAWQHVRDVPLDVLGDVVGVSAAYVKACAHGHPGAAEPTAEMIKAWAALLGCTADELCSTTPHDPADYWRGVNKAMGPMSRDDLEAVADIVDRTARRRATQR